MANTSFDEGLAMAEQRRRDRETTDLLNRQALAKQWEEYANNVRLPADTSSPKYQKALKQRTDALNTIERLYTPDHHATLAERIHGLIFGPKRQQGATTTPVSSQAPVAPGGALPASGMLGNIPTSAYSSAPAGTEPPPDPAHPFQHNPVYGKILNGLEGLGRHLKGFAQPNGPAQPLPSLAEMADVPTTADLAARDVEAQASNAQKLEQMRADAQTEVARIRANAGQTSTPQKAFLNRWAVSNGADGFADLAPDQQAEAVMEWKKANAGPVKMTFKSLEGKLYGIDPTSGIMKFIANDADVTVTTTERPFTNQLTGEVTMIPLTTVRSKKTGLPIAGTDTGSEGNAASPSPVSSQAPSFDGFNARDASGSATRAKPTGSKPRSSQAPTLPRVVAHTASLLDKSNAAQYTKAAEDANDKKKAYLSAEEALHNPTASSDQELIYSWVRSNVQGAGRMTQAEFRQAASVGSLPQRAQAWFERSKSGRLPPEIEQMMFADIKRAYETSQSEANDLKGNIDGSPQPAPSATPGGFNWNSFPESPK